jgi:tetratricopeptide (TPR) repeat protein
LIDAATDTHLWAKTYEAPAADVLGVEATAARDVAHLLHLSAASSDAVAATRRVDPSAYEAYHRGRRAATIPVRPRLIEAVGDYEEAIRRDPSYAAAYAELAHAYGMLGFVDGSPPDENARKFRTLTRKALDLDPLSPAAHVNLGDIKFYGDWDWENGLAEFRRAVELDPSSSDAADHYALALAVLTRYDAAVREILRGVRGDPLSPALHARLGEILLERGDAQVALPVYLRAIELEPGYAEAFDGLGRVYETLGREQEAIAVYLRANSLGGVNPDSIKALSDGYARGGMRGYWTTRLELLEADATRGAVSPLALASVRAHAGRVEEAVDSLERAHAQHVPALPFIKTRSDWRPLRSSGRFQTLVHMMRFPA